MEIYRLGCEETQDSEITFYCKYCDKRYGFSVTDFWAMIPQDKWLGCPKGHVLIYPKRIN